MSVRSEIERSDKVKLFLLVVFCFVPNDSGLDLKLTFFSLLGFNHVLVKWALNAIACPITYPFRLSLIPKVIHG